MALEAKYFWILILLSWGTSYLTLKQLLLIAHVSVTNRLRINLSLYTALVMLPVTIKKALLAGAYLICTRPSPNNNAQ